MFEPPRFMVVEARFYEDISDLLIAGAMPVLEEAGVVVERFTVPGALEIPAAMKFARDKFDAFIGLGCVIRGETSHYDTVCNESARGLMDLSIHYDMPLANGILTCESKEQALERADPDRLNKGAAFAKTALVMLEQKKYYL